MRARRTQEARLGSGRTNAEMTPAELHRHCRLDQASRQILESGQRQLGLSARGWDRCLRMARTIADLAGEEAIAVEHLSEALNRRRRGD
jgi:magnesium chelatase family protein